MRSNDAFRKKVAAFVKRAQTNPEVAARAISLNLLRSVVKLSPVDTGRFRGNWFAQYTTDPQTIDAASGGKRNSKGQFISDASGAGVLARAEETLKNFRLGMGKIFLLNHLPYSIRLEYGWSKQAPSGMVRITLARFKAIWEQAVKDAVKP